MFADYAPRADVADVGQGVPHAVDRSVGLTLAIIKLDMLMSSHCGEEPHSREGALLVESKQPTETNSHTDEHEENRENRDPNYVEQHVHQIADAQSRYDP